MARIFREDPEAVANARLIAAAPDLLEIARTALIHAKHAFPCESVPSWADKNMTGECDCYIAKLRATISKAEGGK